MQVVVADVEVGARGAGYHVGGGVGHRNQRRLHTRGLKARRPRIHRRGGHTIEDARELGDRVVGEMRVGRVPLLAGHRHLGIHIAAAADLDLVTQKVGAGGLAD